MEVTILTDGPGADRVGTRFDQTTMSVRDRIDMLAAALINEIHYWNGDQTCKDRAIEHAEMASRWGVKAVAGDPSHAEDATTAIGADAKKDSGETDAEKLAKKVADLLAKGSGLTWDEAHTLLCAGHHVRRASWTMPQLFQWGYFGVARYKGAAGFWQMTLYAGTISADVCNLYWKPSDEERKATDWQIHEF